MEEKKAHPFLARIPSTHIYYIKQCPSIFGEPMPDNRTTTSIGNCSESHTRKSAANPSHATLDLLLPSIRLTTNKRNGQPSVDWSSPQILLQQTNSSSTNLQNSHVLAQPLRRPPAYVSCRDANQHTGQNRSSLPVKERLPPDTMLNI